MLKQKKDVNGLPILETEEQKLDFVKHKASVLNTLTSNPFMLLAASYTAVSAFNALMSNSTPYLGQVGVAVGGFSMGYLWSKRNFLKKQPKVISKSIAVVSGAIGLTLGYMNNYFGIGGGENILMNVLPSISYADSATTIVNSISTLLISKSSFDLLQAIKWNKTHKEFNEKYYRPSEKSLLDKFDMYYKGLYAQYEESDAERQRKEEKKLAIQRAKEEKERGFETPLERRRRLNGNVDSPNKNLIQEELLGNDLMNPDFGLKNKLSMSQNKEHEMNNKEQSLNEIDIDNLDKQQRLDLIKKIKQDLATNLSVEDVKVRVDVIKKITEKTKGLSPK